MEYVRRLRDEIASREIKVFISFIYHDFPILTERRIVRRSGLIAYLLEGRSNRSIERVHIVHHGWFIYSNSEHRTVLVYRVRVELWNHWRNRVCRDQIEVQCSWLQVEHRWIDAWHWEDHIPTRDCSACRDRSIIHDSETQLVHTFREVKYLTVETHSEVLWSQVHVYFNADIRSISKREDCVKWIPAVRDVQNRFLVHGDL